jgi:basic membrane protein A
MKYNVLIILFISVVSCSFSNNDDSTETTNQETPKVKIGFLNRNKVIGDDSFSEKMYNGIIEFSRYNSIEFHYQIPTSNSSKEMYLALLDLVETEDCDFIISAGQLVIDPIRSIAPKYPDKTFAVLDVKISDIDNVISVYYPGYKSAYVIGGIAARLSKTSNVGFIGGVDEPMILEFRDGFTKGAQSINPKINVISQFCSFFPDYNGYSDPDRARILAVSLFINDVDTIFTFAGESSNGILASNNLGDNKIIGVDYNPHIIDGKNIISSLNRNTDIVIFKLCEKYINNELRGGTILDFNLQPYSEDSDPTIKVHSFYLPANIKKSILPLIEQSKKIPTPTVYL